ncbi:MAG: hypothetical protein HQL58_05000 [Magnetococcales bacterium]|nr:hypothetical protein [Magnetococcales bacterium]
MTEVAFRRWTTAWLIVVVMVFGLFAITGVAVLDTAQQQTLDNSSWRYPSQTVAPNENHRSVVAGIYLDRLFDFLPNKARWSVDFYLWFRWLGDGLTPGESFQIVDGEIVKKHEITRFDQDNRHYVLYRVTAIMTKAFDPARFPQDRHVLTIRIEDTDNHHGAVQFIPDVEGSAISSRLEAPGYAIVGSKIIEQPHSYKTRRGDTRLALDHTTTYSQLVLAIGLQRAGWHLYIKMFLGTFVAVAIALVAFLINPHYNSPRLATGIGSFFAAVASNYVLSQQVLPSNTLTLTDLVTFSALATIFMTLLSSCISLGAHGHGMPATAIRRFDLTALTVFLVGMSGINIIYAMVANSV